MTPIQVWFPRFNGGVRSLDLQRDMHRAFRAWDGEYVVWTMPGWTNVERWIERGGMSVLGIPGDCFERVNIAHVGDNGKLVYPDVPESAGYSTDRLLDLWLNGDGPTLEQVPVDDRITTTGPVVEDGSVFMATMTLRTGSSGWLPIVGTGELSGSSENERVALTQWPPENDGLQTVSPETESAELNPSSNHPPRSLPVRQVWPRPFTGMMPYFSSLDDLYARDLMRDIAIDSSEDIARAKVRAETEAQPWLSTGWSTVKHTWFEPVLAHEGLNGALIAAEMRYRLEAGSLEEASQREDWREVMRQRVPVRRAWGVPGLMWTLFLDSLNASMPFRHCERCRRLIRARSNRRFCSAKDNEKCYLARRREDRRRSRQSR